jgi:hypothetical protein
MKQRGMPSGFTAGDKSGADAEKRGAPSFTRFTNASAHHQISVSLKPSMLDLSSTFKPDLE